MTPTTDELRALAERLEDDHATLKRLACVQDANSNSGDAAAALRQWIAERERVDALAMICKDANEAAMKHWPCNNPDRNDV